MRAFLHHLEPKWGKVGFHSQPHPLPFPGSCPVLAPSSLSGLWFTLSFWQITGIQIRKLEFLEQGNLLVFWISGLTLQKYLWCFFHCPGMPVLTVFVCKLLTLTFTLPLTHSFAYPKIIASCFLFALIYVDLPWILPIILGRGQQYFPAADLIYQTIRSPVLYLAGLVLPS